ncbi:MAG: hypothetical protein ABW019_07130 [Chitinophagaceae bacterium]
MNKRVIVAVILFSCLRIQAQLPLWQSDAYSVYADRVVQAQYTARVMEPGHLLSDYKSPANAFRSSVITFKFSINGKDNEMASGTDHIFHCDSKSLYAETPLITFGTPLRETKPQPAGFLQPGMKLKIRVDMRPVLSQWKEKGYYTAFDQTRIYKQDFKGLYVAGNAAPLIWDFDNLVHHPDLQLTDADGDGIYEVVLDLNRPEDDKLTAAEWKQSKDLSAYPRYQSPYPLSDALYNLSLEEMVNAIEPDSTFRTGKEWAGVWTRDISYSIILAMAQLQPEVARYSLLRKVSKKNKIIQDTGTGGAWPVSTDRMVWAIAAWELYKVTGDHNWLQESYTIIKNSLEDDLANIYDKTTGLVKGESSFLDWREQTYPKWMQPADIFESQCLGTNAVHYKANWVLAQMARLLHDPATEQKHDAIAGQIKNGINQYLWLPQQQYYGQYRYGRIDQVISPRAEALGEALCVLFGIADSSRQRQVVRHTPATPYGIPCIYPQIPGIPPYHNNGIWPFVQAYWMLASAKAGNEEAVMEGIAAIYRPAALFATNKENFVAENGDFAGTQINSSNMLWSLSGNLGIVYSLLFGMQYQESRLSFYPFVPEALKGRRSLQGFHYRGAVLDINMEGWGNRIGSFLVDGKEQLPELPATLQGKHTVTIILDSLHAAWTRGINKLPVRFTLPAPVMTIEKNKFSWQAVDGAVGYRLLRNGVLWKELTTPGFTLPPGEVGRYQVMAVDKEGITSFAGEPVVVPGVPDIVYQLEEVTAPAAYPYNGYMGKGFIEISTEKNRIVTFTVDIPVAGDFALDIRYANGNGPSNTDNKCALRTLVVDGRTAGTLLFPQRGKDEWSNWGYSNPVRLNLASGRHTISLQLTDHNANMNEAINQAMLDEVRIRKL